MNKKVKVILANRHAGSFWSIEKLFSNVAEAFPHWVTCTVKTAPRQRAKLRSILANIFWLRSLKDCDLIHLTGDIHYAIIGMWRRPVVLTIHDLRFIEETRGLKRLLFWCLWLYLPCCQATFVTVISEFTKDRLLSLCRINPQKVRVIPNCVAPEFAAAIKPWPAGKPRLLVIGTTENKNLTRIGEACTGLMIKLSILGVPTSSQRAELERQGVDYQTYNNLNKNEVVALYTACDLVVFASTYEGFGLPILEAQAVGRPVLTSNLSPMREVSGGGALLVDPFNVKDLRKGLVQLLENPQLRASLVTAGFKNVRNYSATAIAQQYAELYLEIIDNQ